MRPLSEISTNLDLSPDGVWTARTVSPVSYPESGNDIYFAIEDSSFWFRHRNAFILEAARLFPPPGTIFDIGGGNGFVACALQRAGFEVVLVEPGPIGAANAVRRGVRHVVRAAFGDAGFLQGSISAIGLFDVLEHIEDQHRFLASVERCLVPGGRIYITVPASQWLWSREDLDAGHFRRYSVADLSRALQDAGLAVEFATHFFGFLPLPELFARALPYRLGLAGPPPTIERVRADHEAAGFAANRVLRILTGRELRRLRRLRTSRFGSSCLAVARKAGDASGRTLTPAPDQPVAAPPSPPDR
jgi:SAM-dependent methyltransferase